MYIESRFNRLPGVKIERMTEVHYKLIINSRAYKKLIPKLAMIFFKNFEQIRPIALTHKNRSVHLLILWHHAELDTELIPKKEGCFEM